ncbi:MAG: hemerythrin domain-containing protein [Myxococcota bacterium]|nr:hemerythrin domain-containing protein [Myxococcota bacterium]
MLRPGQVRRRILDEHTRICGWLAELEHLAIRLRRGEPDLTSELHRRVAALRTFFLSHLELEERVLAPALRRAGGVGPERAARLQAEHGAQREALARFADGLAASGVPVATLADAVDAFVADVRRDMHAEEALELDPDLLRDDPDEDAAIP